MEDPNTSRLSHFETTSRGDHADLSEPPVLGDSYLSISSHPRPREGGIMVELWWNCLELFFLDVSYDFQTIPDEFQIPVHVPSLRYGMCPPLFSEAATMTHG